jgi:diguanylate cyclase (GGDEF)-like protein
MLSIGKCRRSANNSVFLKINVESIAAKVCSCWELSAMNQADHSSVRILVPEQARELLDVHEHVARTVAHGDAPREAIRLIAQIIGMKVALLCKEDGMWSVVTTAGDGPDVPPLDATTIEELDRVGDASAVVVKAWQRDRRDWTLLGLTRRTGTPAVLLIERDWTLSQNTLLPFAESLLTAERTYALSDSAHARVATHRLSRALARVTGFRDVATIAVRDAARAVHAELATVAVADADNQSLRIMATHGYPLALVEHLSIPRGLGVLGSVYESGKAVRVRDVTQLTGVPPRSRYRTKSYAAIPICAGPEVIGALCVTDRIDGRPFTQGDLSTLRTLAATMALALARERARAQAESYAEAAAIDPVSALFNRRYFSARLEEELQRADRYGLSVGLLMIDIDDFKLINDTCGHLAGDTVIRDVADVLRRSVRVFDICTRFGGDEFAVVMPSSGAEDAMRIADRIRERIEAHRPKDADIGPAKVTASIGLTVSSSGTTARELISNADQALYKAKREGKNRVKTSG